MIRLACALAAAVATALSTAAPACADPVADLMDLLPAGYSGDACQAIDPGTALAAVSCGANSLDGGPTSAIYQLFVDNETLQEAFSSVLTGVDWTAATCPGARSDDPTSLTRSDGTTYGSVGCGRSRTFHTDRDGGVAWTRDADRLLGVAWVGYQGQAYPTSLFDWVRGQVN